MPRLLKNTLNSGLMPTLLITSPTPVEITIAGIKDNAVCSTSCPVVNPRDFIIP